MFERFTNRARQAVVMAQEEARLHNHDHIGTEHLLLGVLRVGEGIAAKVLASLGLELEQVRAEVVEVLSASGSGDEAPADKVRKRRARGNVPFTAGARKVMELSLRQALELRHNYIGTEHMLLGLLKEGEGVAAQVLAGRDIGYDLVRRRIVDLLAGHDPGGSPGTETRPGPAAVDRHTPAADLALHRAGERAGERPIGTHHLLLGIIGTDSVGDQILGEHGVTEGAVESHLAEHGTRGTLDETAEEALARKITVESTGGVLHITIADPGLAGALEEAGAGGEPPPVLGGILRALAGLVDGGDLEDRGPGGGPRLTCTFCGKSQRDVEKLIAGPGAHICDECVALCNRIIVEEVGPGVADFGETDDDRRDSDG